MRLFISIQQNFQNLKSLVIKDILDWFNKLSIRRSPLLKTSGSLKKWQGTHKLSHFVFLPFLVRKVSALLYQTALAKCTFQTECLANFKKPFSN